MQRHTVKLFAKRAVVATMVAATASFSFYPTVRAVSALTVNDNQITDWTGVKSGDNYVFTFTMSDDASSFYAADRKIQIGYSDGQSHGQYESITFYGWSQGIVRDGYNHEIAGANITASGNVVTVTVPASFFANEDFTASFDGASLTSAEMGASVGDNTGSDSGNTGGTESGSGAESGSTGSDSSDTGSSAYTGIKIDGDFSDWDGVPKYDVKDLDQNGNPKGYDTVNKMAMVWDGDWVYLYFESNDKNYTGVCGAGAQSNGQYVITTDLGNQSLVQLQPGPTVSGIDGAEVAVNNTEWGKTPHKWEVAVPASVLGNYSKTISFGIYRQESVITGVANLQGDSGGKTFDGIIYDGKYDDWDGYPHTTIQYATAGTHAHVVDSRAALYADSEAHTLYGHAVTTMPEHLNEKGGEFTSAVLIRINGDDDLMLTPRFIAVDAGGNINWNPTLQGLADGTYEFYLTSTTVDGTSKNINDLKADDVIYGKATITIADGQQDMEWYMDIPTLAKNLHTGWGQSKNTVSIDPNSITKFESQYGRLGQQWVETAGVSTAPFVGVGLGVAAVAGTYAYRRRKNGDGDDGAKPALPEARA